MKRRKQDVLAWESRWSTPTGILTFVAVIILIVSAIVIASVNGSGEAELLVSAHEHSSSITISSVLEAIGFLILTAPLYFLFRAALNRSSGRMKSQLVGVIVVAPLFFAVSGVLNGIATNEAAETFHKGEAKSTLSAEKGAEECRDEEREKGAKDFKEKYDVGTSPLEMAGAYAAVANEGKFNQPAPILSVTDSEGHGISGAKVIARADHGDGQSVESVSRATDAAGYYEFGAVPISSGLSLQVRLSPGDVPPGPWSSAIKTRMVFTASR